MVRVEIKISKTGKRLRTFSNIIMVIGVIIAIIIFFLGTFEYDEAVMFTLIVYSIAVFFISLTLGFICRGLSDLVTNSHIHLEIKKFESRQLGYVYVEED